MMNFLKHYISEKQLCCMTLTPAGDNKLNEIYRTISETPVIQFEEDEDKETIFRLHYFLGKSHLYISERDNTIEQEQAFGYVVMNGDYQMAEYGYINLDMYLEIGFELDLDFKPIKAELLINSFKTK